MLARIERSVALLALTVLFGVAVSEVHDFDLFWQLQSGRYMLQTGSWIYRDLFTLAADVPRFEHCWLHDLIFYGVFRLGGYGAISVLKGVLLTATGGLLAWTARRRGAAWRTILLLGMPLMLMTRGVWAERPQLWTFFLFALFLLVFDDWSRRGGRRIYWLLPAMLLWTNLHAGSLIAFPLWLAFAAGAAGVALLRAPRTIWQRLVPLIIVLVGFLAASLATPYGGQLLRTLHVLPGIGSGGGSGGSNSDGGAAVAKVADHSRQMLTQFNLDWQVTTFANDPLFFFLVGFCLILLLLGWRRLALVDVCLLGGLTLMGLKLSRHVPFLFFAAIAVLPGYLEAAVTPLAQRFSERMRRVVAGAVLAAALLLSLWLVQPVVATSGFFNPGLRTWHFPVAAAEFVRAEKLPANLYNTYDWGGYLSWQLYPDYLVFWDQRQDSAEMFRYGWEAMSGKENWRAIFERFEVKTVVTKTCTVDTGEHYPLLDRLRESRDWALVFADVSALVFVERNAVPEAWLSAHELPPSRIDDTILSEATLLAESEPRRYMAWWEIARIRMARREYPAAFAALQEHVNYAPEGRRVPAAENYYRILYPLMQGRQ